MKYTSSLCDGCGLPLREDDDVVVCPECGTPQHRECYKKENRCVNEYRHSEKYEWQSGPVSAPNHSHAEEATEKMLPCPSCGHLNPKQAKHCENCSMKLIVFGMNLAEASEQQKEFDTPKDDVSDYEAPFTLGQGDGFYTPEAENPEPEQAAYENEGYAPPEQVFYSEEGFPSPQQKSFEAEARSRENARQYLLFRFLGANASKFINTFRKIDSKRGFTFNWAAFFFGPYWFFYRKLYKPGVIFITLSTVVSIVFTPTLSQFVSVTEAYRSYGEALYTDEALLNAFVQEVMPLYPIVAAYFVANLAISVLSALIAYPVYKKYAEGSVERIMSAPSSQTGLSLVSKLGGTSIIAPIAGYFVLSLVSSFIEVIMYGV